MERWVKVAMEGGASTKWWSSVVVLSLELEVLPGGRDGVV